MSLKLIAFNVLAIFVQFPFMECILSSFADTISAFRNLILRNLTSITFLLLTMVTYIGVPCFMKVRQHISGMRCNSNLQVLGQ